MHCPRNRTRSKLLSREADGAAWLLRGKPHCLQGDKGVNFEGTFYKYAKLFEKHFGKIADHKQNGFTAANTALFRDGIFVYVPEGVKVENTMQLIKMINREEPLMVNSRNLIILSKNSKLTFMHCDDSVNHYVSFINTLTESETILLSPLSVCSV